MLDFRKLWDDALTFETCKRHQQTRQSHDLTGLKTWNASEEVERHHTSRAHAADRGPIGGKAQSRLSKRHAERAGTRNRRCDEIWNVEPVCGGAVRKRMRVDGSKEFHRKA